MTKIVFMFAGTGDKGDNFANRLEADNSFNNHDVIRIYIKGCQHKNVGGNALYPDLEIVSNKISKAFSTNKTIDLDILTAEMGDAISRIEGPAYLNNPQITNIGLYGFSRGAVSAYATAKKLDALGIPLDIIANQPVSGQMAKHSARSLYTQYHDLTDCKNINSVTTLLGSYHLANGVIQDTFFQQMVAKFPPSLIAEDKVQHLLLPHQAHLESMGHWIVPYHIQNQFMQNGYSDPNLNNADAMKNQIKEEYSNKAFYFTPQKYSQPILGAENVKITMDPLYVELIKTQAHEILKQQDKTLSTQQAKAIVEIASMTSLSDADKTKHYQLICKDNPSAKKFTAIVNQTSDIVEYLNHQNFKEMTEEDIKAFNDYKKTIFQSSYVFLSKDNPSREDQQRFSQRIQDAGNNLKKAESQLEPKRVHRLVKSVVNTVLVVLGLKKDKSLVNTVNSSQAIKTTLDDIKKAKKTDLENNDNITHVTRHFLK